MSHDEFYDVCKSMTEWKPQPGWEKEEILFFWRKYREKIFTWKPQKKRREDITKIDFRETDCVYHM